MTAADLQKRVADLYRKYLVDPAVTVTVTKAFVASTKITLLGAAGSVEINYRPGMRIVEFLAHHATLSPKADFSRITITLAGDTSRLLDLSGLENRAGTEADIALEAGAVVRVPGRALTITVLGEVGRPGTYEYHEGYTILDMLAAAGMITEESDLESAVIVRAGKVDGLDLDAMLRHNDLSGNRKVAAGETIYVPHLPDRVYVWGAVAQPGFYKLRSAKRLFDALRMAGPLPEADLGRVHLLRVDIDANTTQAKAINATRWQGSGDDPANVELRRRDVLMIMAKGSRFDDSGGLRFPDRLPDPVIQWLSQGPRRNRF